MQKYADDACDDAAAGKDAISGTMMLMIMVMILMILAMMKTSMIDSDP